MRGIFTVVGAAAAAIALALQQDRAAELEAGTALRMDLAELVDASELVLEARVVSARPVEAPDGLVHTEYQLAVDRTFFGEDLPVRTVRLPGGVLPGGRGTLVPGMPELVPGEDVVVMLSPASHLGNRMPIGLHQGKYRIVADGRGGKVAVRASGALLNGATGRLRPDGGLEVVDFAELVARLESAAAARRARGEGR